MTAEDQQFILENFVAHLRDNVGNRLTDAMAHGMIAVLTAITSSRIDKPQEPASPD